MCIAGAGAILGVLGGVASFAGSMMQAQGQMQAAEAEARTREYRSKQSRLLAEDAMRRGAQKEYSHRQRVRALTGRQRAVQAASGLDLSSGSPLQVMADTAELGELDAQRIRDNSRREKQAHDVDAELGEFAAADARQAGSLAAAGTILGGFGSLAKSWYSYAS